MESQIVLITGATSGIGRHAALYLARRGHRVIATGRREGALRDLLTEAEGLPLDTLRLDVDDAESIDAARREVDELTGGHGLDVLINNAGYGQGGAVLDLDMAAVRRQYETNVFGVMAVTRAFVPAMVARGRGRIINVTSIGGKMTFPLMGAYNSTKYALESLSDALRAELRPLGVDVSIVEPGVIRSSFNDTFQASLDEDAPEAKGPWAPVYAQSEEAAQRMLWMESDPVTVSRAFARAIEARRPRARYVAPAWAGVFILAARVVPTPIWDFFMARFIGLHLVRKAPLTLSIAA